MKTTSWLGAPVVAAVRVAVVLARCLGLWLVLSWLAGSTPALAQSDNFNDGNDNGWTHYDPIGSAGAGPHAAYSVENGRYRIQALKRHPLLPPQVGPPRAGSIREDVIYTSFYIEVDVTGWNDATNQAFGFLARVQEGSGLGQTDAYAVTYQTRYHDIQISVVSNEVPIEVTALPDSSPDPDVTMDPTKVYRMVFKGVNDILEARVYLASDLTTPLAFLKVRHDQWARGTCGLVVYDNSDGGGMSDVLFDNYFAASEEPVRLYAQLTTFQSLKLNWSTNFPGYRLESTANLTTPTSTWTEESAGPFNIVGEMYQFEVDAFEGNKFFRLVK